VFVTLCAKGGREWGLVYRGEGRGEKVPVVKLLLNVPFREACRIPVDHVLRLSAFFVSVFGDDAGDVTW
jgi:hypothetical protein